MKKVAMISLLFCTHGLLCMKGEEKKQLFVKKVPASNIAYAPKKTLSSPRIHVENNKVADSPEQRCSALTLPISVAYAIEWKSLLSQNSDNDAEYTPLDKQEDEKKKKKNIIDEVKGQAQVRVEKFVPTPERV